MIKTLLSEIVTIKVGFSCNCIMFFLGICILGFRVKILEQKRLLANLIFSSSKGSSILHLLTLVPSHPPPTITTYIQLMLGDKKDPSSPSPSSSSPTPTKATLTPELITILKRCGAKETTSAGLKELWVYMDKHNIDDISPVLAKVSANFRNYVLKKDRGRREKERERREREAKMVGGEENEKENGAGKEVSLSSCPSSPSRSSPSPSPSAQSSSFSLLDRLSSFSDNNTRNPLSPHPISSSISSSNLPPLGSLREQLEGVKEEMKQMRAIEEEFAAQPLSVPSSSSSSFSSSSLASLEELRASLEEVKQLRETSV